MHRIDAWWNRRFPAFSRARLGFLIAATPVVGVAVEWVWSVVRDTPFSLPRSALMCVTTASTVALGFVPGMRERAARTTRPDLDRTMAPPSGSSRDAVRGFLVAFPFALGLMVVIHLVVAGASGAFAPTAMITQLVGAAITATVVALRTSVWSLALVSALGGALGGVAVAMMSVLTFSTPTALEVAVGWVLGSAVVFTFLWPAWQCVRRLEARGARLPIWLVMGATLLLVAGSSLVFVAES